MFHWGLSVITVGVVIAFGFLPLLLYMLISVVAVQLNYLSYLGKNYRNIPYIIQIICKVLISVLIIHNKNLDLDLLYSLCGN